MGRFLGGSCNLRYFIHNFEPENMSMFLGFDLQHSQIVSEPKKKKKKNANEEPCEPSLDWKGTEVLKLPHIFLSLIVVITHN